MSDGPPAALLTSTQREYLFPDTNEKERQGAEERAFKSRLRRRIYFGLHDGMLIWQNLDPEERRKIFNIWKKAGEEVEYVDDTPGEEILKFDRAAQREQGRFEKALISMVAFIYLGALEAGEFDADSIITNAVATAEEARGNRIKAKLEKLPRYDVEELMDRFEERDPTLQVAELEYLKREGKITREEQEAYQKEVFELANEGGSGTGMFMNQDEAADLLGVEDKDADDEE